MEEGRIQNRACSVHGAAGHAKHGKRLSTEEDFPLSDEKIGDYFVGVRRVLTNLFGSREVLAYVTAAERESGSRRLFFSSVSPERLSIF